MILQPKLDCHRTCQLDDYLEKSEKNLGILYLIAYTKMQLVKDSSITYDAARFSRSGD